MTVVAVAVLSRARMRIAVHDDGTVEIARTWIVSRRWWLRRSSILHVEVTHGALGLVIADDVLRLVVADRGARTFTLRGLARADATRIYDALVEADGLGTYASLRNRGR